MAGVVRSRSEAGLSGDGARLPAPHVRDAGIASPRRSDTVDEDAALMESQVTFEPYTLPPFEPVVVQLHLSNGKENVPVAQHPLFSRFGATRCGLRVSVSSGKIMVDKPDSGGRKVTHICYDERMHNIMLNRFVFACWNGPLPNNRLFHVDHIDNNKLNNALSNLQLLSAAQNCAKRHVQSPTSRTRTASSRSVPVTIRKAGVVISFPSQKAAATYIDRDGGGGSSNGNIRTVLARGSGTVKGWEVGWNPPVEWADLPHERWRNFPIPGKAANYVQVSDMGRIKLDGMRVTRGSLQSGNMITAFNLPKAEGSRTPRQLQCLVHRLVAHVYLEMPLDSPNIVHHRNSDLQDNRLENLVALSNAADAKVRPFLRLTNNQTGAVQMFDNQQQLAARLRTTQQTISAVCARSPDGPADWLNMYTIECVDPAPRFT